MKACDLATDVEAAVDSGDYDEFDSDIYDAGNSLVFVKTNWTFLVSPRSFTRHHAPVFHSKVFQTTQSPYQTLNNPPYSDPLL